MSDYNLCVKEPLTLDEIRLIKETIMDYDGFLGSGPITDFHSKLIKNGMLQCKDNPYYGYDFYLNQRAIEFVSSVNSFDNEL